MDNWDIMTCSPAEIFEMFRLTFTETNSQKRNDIEAKLKFFEEKPLDLLNFVVHILPNSEFNDRSTKLSVCAFLKNVIKGKLDKRLNFEKELGEVLNILVPLSLKCSQAGSNQIQEQLNLIIGMIVSRPEFQSLETFNRLIEYVDSLLDKKDIPQLASSILIIQVLIAAPIKVLYVQEVFSKARQCIHILNEIANDYLSRFTAFSSSTDIELFLKLVLIKRIFYELLFLMTIKLKKSEILTATLTEELISQYLDDACSTVLFQSETSSFISFTGLKEIDSALNLMKCKSFMWISILIQNEGIEIKNKTLVEKCMRLFFSVVAGFKIVLTTKYDYISLMTKDDIKYPDNDYSTLIFQANLFISRLLVREPIVNNMNKHIKE